MSEDSTYFIEPFKYQATGKGDAWRLIMAILEVEERCKIITAEENYIHTEFRTRIFRFVDDVEFFFPKAADIIHIKSASRLGKSDLGVNRQRVEMLREKFEKALPREI